MNITLPPLTYGMEVLPSLPLLVHPIAPRCWDWHSRPEGAYESHEQRRNPRSKAQSLHR